MANHVQLILRSKAVRSSESRPARIDQRVCITRNRKCMTLLSKDNAARATSGQQQTKPREGRGISKSGGLYLERSSVEIDAVHTQKASDTKADS